MKCVARLASFRGGVEHDDAWSFAARLNQLIDEDCAASFSGGMNPSGSIQNVDGKLRSVRIWRVFIDLGETFVVR